MGASPERDDRLDEHFSYVMRPTRWTLFLRTFLPWQAWRFVAINLKMLRMLRRVERAGERDETLPQESRDRDGHGDSS